MLKVAKCYRNLHSFWSQAMPYYAVAAGWKIGIYDTWASCESQVKGFSKPKYKKFKTKKEAEGFLKENGIRMDLIGLPKQNIEIKTEECTVGSTYLQDLMEVKKEECPLQKTEDDWSNYVELNKDDDDLLLAAAAEVEGIPESSRKRQGSTIVSESESSEKLKKYTHDSKIWEPIGLKKIGNFEFPIDSEGYVIVYTDGSCINNGKADCFAGFGVYFSEGHALNVGMPVIGRVTNNAGEIQAAIHAIKIAKDFGIRKLCISTDSQFLINAVTFWIKGWKRRGWKVKTGQPVKNVDDFRILDNLLDGSVDIKWNYVRGHKGIVGNEKADRLARKGADIYRENMTK